MVPYEQTDVRPDIKKLIIAFRNFTNAPKMNFCSSILEISLLNEYQKYLLGVKTVGAQR